MVSTVPEAEAAERAGADVIVAQGNEGGGHVGTMGSSVLVPMVAARTSVPVLAAGGFATGAGLAAALAMGADGILLGTRFLATHEAPLHPRFKQAILDSDGHDTIATEITDVAQGTVWPGAYARVKRNRLVEDWIGREGELRRRQPEVARRMAEARRAGDPDYAILYTGQTAGLIDELLSAGEVVTSIAAGAEEIIRSRLAGMVGAEDA
jgi:NAD(P)H-dependent flavin oxidoreductase YrpB (nitropropane dioxygenase family)